MSLWTRLTLNPDQHRAVALVGGGGKTTLLCALAREAREAGRTVVVTTTTHMWLHPRLPLTGWTGEEPLRAALDQQGIVLLGQPVPGGKLTGAGDLAACLRAADVVLIEADGSRGLPLKAPADYEPAIPPQADGVIAVAGADCVGRPIGEICHRPERVCALLNRSAEDLVTPSDAAAVLASPAGGRKCVPAGAAFRCAVNRADLAPGAAREICRALLDRGIPAAVTAFPEKTAAPF